MKQVYQNEWVKVQNKLSKKFSAGKPCSQCSVFKQNMVWYSIISGEVKCLNCFDPTK